jgi:hypothetical protein
LTGIRGPHEVDARVARAASLVRALPIRWSEHDGGGTEAEVTERGWFQGADECARILAASTALELRRGGGFGGRWPLLRGTGCVLSPALPVAACAGVAVGPDGEYSLDAAGVSREAVGTRQLYLATDTSQPSPGAPFDLLWFGDAERVLVRDGSLEIDDLFGTLRMPASPRLLDQILIRRLRVDRDVLASLPLAATDGPQVIEVRRPAVLSIDDRWRDATRFLATRADIEEVRQRGAALEARVVGGLDVTFELEEGHGGWKLKQRAGDYALNEIRLDHGSNMLSLCATLDPRVDALAPAIRGRLIFDLRSDLVALG